MTRPTIEPTVSPSSDAPAGFMQLNRHCSSSTNSGRAIPSTAGTRTCPGAPPPSLVIRPLCPMAGPRLQRAAVRLPRAGRGGRLGLPMAGVDHDRLVEGPLPRQDGVQLAAVEFVGPVGD